MPKLILVSIVLMASLEINIKQTTVGRTARRVVQIDSYKPIKTMTIEEQIEFHTNLLEASQLTGFAGNVGMRNSKGECNKDNLIERTKGKLRLLKLMKKRQNKKK